MKIINYAEQRQHGTVDFPLQYYFVNKNALRYEMEAHWHKEYELIRVLSGKIDLYLDNVVYSLSSGDVVLVSSGVLHRGLPKNCVYECLVFDLNMLIPTKSSAVTRNLVPLCNGEYSVLNPKFSEKSKVYETAKMLFETVKRQKKHFELEIYSLLYQLCFDLFSEEVLTSCGENSNRSHSQKIAKIIDWLGHHYTQPVNLKELAKISGYNTRYFCKIFKEATGKTVIQYLNEWRVENACLEMSVNKKSITAAAIDSGFNDLSYFCKTFKKIKGMTPMEYKKKTT